MADVERDDQVETGPDGERETEAAVETPDAPMTDARSSASPTTGVLEPDVPEPDVPVAESSADAGTSQAGADASETARTGTDPAGTVAGESTVDDVDPAAAAASSDIPDGSDVAVRSAELASIVEALIFASPEPLSLKALCKLLDAEPAEDVEAAVAALKSEYDRPGGLQLVEVAGGYQIVTRPDLHEWVRRLFHERSTSKLSVQALETLAVIAYRQPVTAAEITEIRGVNTSGVLNTLLERHLVKIVGRKAVVGRPFMYATTREFLIRFGLNDIADLPKVQDMVDAFGLESPLLIERSLPEDQLPLDEPDADQGAQAAAADADDTASES